MNLTLEMEMDSEHAARLLTWLSAAPDVDVKGSEDHQDRQHDEHGHDDDARCGVTEVEGSVEAAAARSHVATVPESAKRETDWPLPLSLVMEIDDLLRHNSPIGASWVDRVRRVLDHPAWRHIT